MQPITQKSVVHNINYVYTDKTVCYGTEKNVIIFTCYVLTNFEDGYYGER